MIHVTHDMLSCCTFLEHHMVWIYYKIAESTLATSLAKLSVLPWPQLYFIERALTN